MNTENQIAQDVEMWWAWLDGDTDRAEFWLPLDQIIALLDVDAKVAA